MSCLNSFRVTKIQSEYRLIKFQIPFNVISGSSYITGPAQKGLLSLAIFFLSCKSKHMEEHDLAFESAWQIIFFIKLMWNKIAVLPMGFFFFYENGFLLKGVG